MGRELTTSSQCKVPAASDLLCSTQSLGLIAEGSRQFHVK